MIQNARMKRKRRDSEDADGSPEAEEDIPEVGFLPDMASEDFKELVEKKIWK